MHRHIFGFIVMSVCIALLGFFGWHGQYGPRSFANHQLSIAKVVRLEGKRDAARAKREAFEARVSLLRSETIDKDMLDETARRVLGFVHNDDIVVR